MAVNLSPVYGAGAQLFDNNGVPLAGGLIYTYAAGTSTPQATYTSALGTIAHSNPIVLDASGRIPSGEIWLTDGLSYKFVVQTANAVLIATYDNLTGINSNFVAFTSQEETQTATQGQTVFTLTTMQYQPGTDNLLVFVNGSKQIVGQNYTETSGTVVTFVDGLNAGDIVDFTTAIPIASNATTATNVSYNEGGTGAVTRTVSSKLQETVSVKDFGAVGNGTTDDTAAIQAAIAYATTKNIFFPAGTYLTSQPLVFTQPVFLYGETNTTTIKLTATAAYVIEINGSGTGSSWIYGSEINNLLLNGNGFATDGLYIKNVINATFNNIQVTNVTTAGLHLGWAQLCVFNNYICSGNVSVFTTTPVNGILIDASSSSSANTFTNITIEKVSGSGVKALSLINSVFVNGTSEGNNIGFEFGETTSTGRASIGNSVIGVDLEANTTADIVLRNTGGTNHFFGISASSSTSVQIINSDFNSFYGGDAGSIFLDGNSNYNQINGVNLVGSSSTITDSGAYNTIIDCINTSTITITPDKQIRRRTYDVVAAAGTANINAAVTTYAVINAQGSTLTIATPTNPVDGQVMDVTVHNTSGGAITITWGAGYKIAGWTNPATGYNRSVHFAYDTNFGYWYAISMSQVDVPN